MVVLGKVGWGYLGLKRAKLGSIASEMSDMSHYGVEIAFGRVLGGPGRVWIGGAQRVAGRSDQPEPSAVAGC